MIAVMQVDADWLVKKKQLGPTEQDLRVLSEPNPAVELRLFPGGRGRAEAGGLTREVEADRVAYNRSFGLHCAVQPETLLPKYALELNARDIFGSALTQLPRPGSGPGPALAAMDQLVDRVRFAAMVDRLS